MDVDAILVITESVTEMNADVDVILCSVSVTTHVCGSSFFLFSAADAVLPGTDPVTVAADSAMTAVCGSSLFSSSAAEMDAANTFS